MVFKRCIISIKGPKVCQENIPHTITPPPPAWTVETRQDGSMVSCSLRQILTLPSECRSRNRDSSDQAKFFQSSIFQFWWACANCSLCSGYLSYCCLSIISNQSAHSPLNSDINKAFSSTKMPLTGYFFGPLSVNPRDGCAWKSVHQQFLKLSDEPVWHQPFHVQSHLNSLSSPFWCSGWTSASRLHHI